MYSVVLMVALSTSADATELGRRGRGGAGCCGCSASYGCYGGGCYGGGGYGGGGYGCHGGRGYGCYGGGYGCMGYGGGGYGCMGYGGGGYGCMGYGGGYGCYGGGMMYSTPPVKQMDKEKEKEKVGPEKEGSVQAPALIVVNLPANAKLTINGAATTSTSSVRMFSSPVLQPGQEYTYTLRAEVPGETRVLTQDIVVRAGQETRVTMTAPASSGVASSK
jgi:uncharacterized protein (TIGR03000 family)